MGLLSKLFGAKEKAPEVMEDLRVFTDLLDRSDVVNDLYISGVKHHLSRRDVGFFAGAIFNDKDNAYDKKAMVIWDGNNKRVVGYVPAAILDDYRSWCKRRKCSCVGYVFYNGETLLGRVRAYLPECPPENLIADAQEYAKVCCEHFGWPVPSLDA